MPIRPTLLERTALFSLNLAPGIMLDLGGALSFQTVTMAVELELFQTLAEKPLTSAELAQKLSTHERGTDSLLKALASIGYVEEKNGRFANTALTTKWGLSPDGFDLKASLTFWTAVFQDLSPHAVEVLRTGERPYDNIYAWLEENPDISHAFQQQLMLTATLTAADIYKKLKLPAGPIKMLDVGGGHGLFSILFCQENPQLDATVLDTAIALKTAEINVVKHNLAQRVHLHAGDLWEEDWGEGYDLIVLFNLIHHYDDTKNIALLKRCAATLKPGGQVAILDQVTGKIPGGMANAVIQLIALHYFLLADGRVHAHDEIESWFTQTGFTDIRFHKMLKAPGTSLMIGRK